MPDNCKEMSEEGIFSFSYNDFEQKRRALFIHSFRWDSMAILNISA
jgi:hypothetical protein